jgi:hypothetical protein
MQLTIWIEDADANIADLKARGVTLLNGPIDRPWGQRTTTFAHPAGHVWEIAQSIAVCVAPGGSQSRNRWMQIRLFGRDRSAPTRVE